MKPVSFVVTAILFAATIVHAEVPGRDFRVVAAEMNNCLAAYGACVLDYSTMSMLLAPDTILLDTDCDGVREIADSSEIEEFRQIHGNPTVDGFCR